MGVDSISDALKAPSPVMPLFTLSHTTQTFTRTQCGVDAYLMHNLHFGRDVATSLPGLRAPGLDRAAATVDRAHPSPGAAVAGRGQDAAQGRLPWPHHARGRGARQPVAAAPPE